ncbi:type I-C CRISPR-associated protein Cas5 [Marispirochaeta aestuarii]|uniref:pre-crRNA processing endonuclease n=1 Tax=Marispirochaeta aestuarii TaxID=1963862 RepID=A0A1Y1RUT0_9SPIO|nr:type I-C CRISPR-associated protein Cas5c [Marispirochaeta aestuarii]ORC32839.1 type I-C CRISPR-associated protein Cas5 [Marispirochaeta aestuarii]
MSWCLEVWGDYACFTRPEMKVERVSYDVMTPSAARAIYEAILWKPAIRWHITRIDVLEPIKWISVRRNEVGKIFTGPTQAHLDGRSGDPMGFAVEDYRQQRAGLFLRDVRYRIHAWFEFIPQEKRIRNKSVTPEFWADSEEASQFVNANENEGKYAAMFERRARKGQCFHRPYLGCREFACDFKLVDPSHDLPPSIEKTDDLGWMLYDLNFEDPQDPQPMFFRALLENGTINTDRNSVEVRG